MTERVKVKSLLQQAEAVAAGLLKEDIGEQSNCFVFKDGWIHTHNDGVSCRCKSSMPIDCVITAKPYLKYLRTLEDLWVSVDKTEVGLEITNYNKQAVFYIKKEISTDIIELPEQWKPIPDKLIEAMKWVYPCADTNAQRIVLYCVHIHPDYVEAFDNYQASRYKLKTGFDNSLLICRDYVSMITNIKPTEYGFTENWIHFKNKQDLIISSCYGPIKFPDLNKLFESKNSTVIEWPKDILKKIDDCTCFNGGNSLIQIKINRNKMKIAEKYFDESGKKELSSIEVKSKINYEGKPLCFEINSKTLQDIIKRYGSEFVIKKNRILVGNGKVKEAVAITRVKKTVKNK